MFGTTNYPFNFANRRGIPMIESNSISATTTEVTITLSNRVFRWLNDKGVVLFRLGQAIPTGSEDLPIVFSSNDYTQPVTLVGGDAATGVNLAGVGVYLLYYDKDANLMQLLTMAASAN